MRITKSSVVGVLLGLSIFTACRGSGNTAKPDGPETTGDTGDGRIHIQDVQSDTMAPGTAVELHGVIVTAVDKFGTRNGDVWVEEPGGGAFSGIHVFGAPVAQVANLMPGDVVDITGAIKSEFIITGDTSGGSLTEVQAPKGATLTITKVNTAAIPAPMVVDALAIGQKATQAERDAEWEKWEGVLITVNNVAALGQPACITSRGMCPDPTFQRFNVTGDLVVESGLAAMPEAGVVADACLTSLTGVIDYAFDYVIYPRATSEIGLGGAACPAKEATPAACADGIDNDGNGFKDCDDNACVVGASACRAVSTIFSIQMTTPATPVELKDVFVTAVAANKKSLWVSTNLVAAQNEGVFVFRSGNAPDLDPTVVPGVKVDVIGKVTEFNDDNAGGTLTEVNGLAVRLTAPPDALPTPRTGQTATMLLGAATASANESVLVTLTDVRLTALGSTANGSIATATQGGATFGVSGEVLTLSSAQLACYSSITGLWTNLEAAASTATTKPNAFGLVLVSLGGVGTNCI